MINWNFLFRSFIQTVIFFIVIALAVAGFIWIYDHVSVKAIIVFDIVAAFIIIWAWQYKELP